MIKTIIFDLGKVIIPFDFKRGYDRMAPLCSYAAAEIPERLRSCDLVTSFEEGKVEPEEFVRQLSAILELNATYEEFCGIWSAIFLPDTLIPESLLVGLKKRYRLLLLSNTNAIHFEMVWQNYPLLKHFDHLVLSYKVGALKPSPMIYREALRHAHCAPEECFFTDDILAYVEGARAAGIDAVQFENREQIERELQARGVVWE
ncbi:MAG TPA: HAD family phosphatase [Bryobacteraceae bacterium]|nr:HAD family phosphatase [Bryobacteraceae bacterium]